MEFGEAGFIASNSSLLKYPSLSLSAVVNAAATLGLSAASSADMRPSLSRSNLRNAAADVSITAKRILLPASSCFALSTSVVWAATIPASANTAAALMAKNKALISLAPQFILHNPVTPVMFRYFGFLKNSMVYGLRVLNGCDEASVGRVFDRRIRRTDGLSSLNTFCSDGLHADARIAPYKT